MYHFVKSLEGLLNQEYVMQLWPMMQKPCVVKHKKVLIIGAKFIENALTAKQGEIGQCSKEISTGDS